MRLYKGTSQGYWYARVYDESGGYVTVARVNSQSDRIYLARSDTKKAIMKVVIHILQSSFITGIRSI